MYRRTWNGEFRVTAAAGGIWRIDGVSAAVGSPHVQFVLTQVIARSVESSARFDAVELNWDESGVCAGLERAGTIHALRARSAFVHAEQPQLYSVLSLPRFGESQRRFWWRVFRWIRIPGGRWLLMWIARRARA